MRQVLRLALRNLKEHKSKSIIIALFIMFGCAIVILGNSFLESVNRGLEKDFRNNYTGDVAISIVPPQGVLIDIFSATATSFTGEIPQIPALPDIEKVQEIVDSQKGIKSQTKLISAQCLMMKGTDEVDYSEIMDDDSLELLDIPVAMLFAGEKDTYFDMFPGQHITEGHYPQIGTNEILVDQRIKNGFEKIFKTELHVGDKVLVAGANSRGVVREGIVCGFFDPANEYSAMFQNIYCDASFARAFADLTYASSFAQDLPDSVDLSLSSMNEDELFGGDDFFFDDEFEFDFDSEFEGFDFTFDFDSDEIDDTVMLASEMDFDSILGDTSLRDELNKTDDGAWHFILMKANNGRDADKIVDELNQKFAEQNLNVRAMNWEKAAYSYTATVEGIGIIFNILIIILAVVVFIIIMNTMTVSVIERTGEIGTMRAIGAEKSFVRLLFFSESFLITVVSSIAGTLLAVVISLIFNSLNISITNAIAKMILGGGLLHFSITWQIVLATILVAIAGSLLSNIYPVSSALKITPLKALSKGE